MYKLTRPNGKDFYSNSVDYAGSIGKIIRVIDYDGPKYICGKGLHASRNPNDCFVGASIPCRAFKVNGIGKIAGDSRKCRYKALKVLKEIDDLDKLFGWKYTEAINPINPFKIKPPKITDNHIVLLKEWVSVWNSIGDSIWNSAWHSAWDSVWHSAWHSVRNSVWHSVWDSVWNSIWNSIRNSIRNSVWDSIGNSIWNSIGNSIWAYMGSFFPNIKKWKYISHKKGVYPYQCCVDLWKQGLVPSYYSKTWRLYGGEKADILYEMKI